MYTLYYGTVPLRVLLLCISTAALIGLAKSGNGTLSPQAQKFLDSVNSGKGFYNGLPYITSLTSENFDELVTNADHSWVIEFYQSWCGYCLRYSPAFKLFAKDLNGWQPVLKVGAVDCNYNSALCRRFGVIHVPSVKYLPPKFRNEYGKVIQLDQRHGDEARKTPEELREEIVNALMLREDLPMLKQQKGRPGEILDTVNTPKKRAAWVVAVTNCKNAPYLGQQLVLDYWHTPQVAIVPMACSFEVDPQHLESDKGSSLSAGFPKEKFSSMFATRRDNSSAKYRQINLSPVDRAGALAALKSFFRPLLIEVPSPFDPKSVPVVKITKSQLIQYAETHSSGTIPFEHSGIVYQVDIEAAIDHSITNELSQAQSIEGRAFTALVRYLYVINRYFPTVKNGKKLFRCLYHNIASKRNTTGLEVLHTYHRCADTFKPVYMDPGSGFLGCRGTLPMFRGFPCSMWMMFHTLQAQAYKRNPWYPKVVLKAMVGYVKHFFACEDCAEHFLAVAKSMPDRFRDPGEPVLFLWDAHNKANERLHGDQTEDPKYPKVIYPPPELCQTCRDEKGGFNRTEVLKFLVKMYTNVDRHVWKELKPRSGPRKRSYSNSNLDWDKTIFF